jgi:RNA polymerase sigma factor (sigma-70 family)
MQPRLHAYCSAILGDAQDADDAVQNTLIKAHAALGADDEVRAVRPWLHRIAHNEAISLMRRRRPVSELAATVEDRAPGPPEAIAEQEEIRAVLQAIVELPERSREALLLREVGGLRHVEVAQALGTSPGNARQAVFEARTALQDDRAGRNASCQAIREEMSRRERRRASRTVRGHLRSCDACRAWSDAETRRRQVLGLAPGAGVSLAGTGGLWSWLGGLFGGGTATGGATVKVVASVAAAAIAPVGVVALQPEPRSRGLDVAGAARTSAAATPEPRTVPVVQATSPSPPATRAKVVPVASRTRAEAVPRRPARKEAKRRASATPTPSRVVPPPAAVAPSRARPVRPATQRAAGAVPAPKVRAPKRSRSRVEVPGRPLAARPVTPSHKRAPAAAAAPRSRSVAR